MRLTQNYHHVIVIKHAFIFKVAPISYFSLSLRLCVLLLFVVLGKQLYTIDCIQLLL